MKQKERMKKHVVMANGFQSLKQYLQLPMDVNGDIDMIDGTFATGVENSLSIDRQRRNDTRLPPDYYHDLDDLDNYDMIGDHYVRSPFGCDMHHRGYPKLTDVKFFNSFADDVDDSDIV